MDEGLYPDHVLKAFENCCESLKSVTLYDGVSDYVIDDRVFTHLAGRAGLVNLRIIEHMGYEMVKSALEKVERPFENVQDLQVTLLDSKAVAPLVAAIQHYGSVARLRLDMLDSEGTFLPIISSLVNLRGLKLLFQAK